MPQEEALKEFGLMPGKPTLLVTGGSLGALSLNRAVIANLRALLSEIQVIHLTGERTWQEVAAAQAELPEELAQNYRPFAYLHDRMRAAFSAADLVTSRAGASTLGELPAFGVPAILVPYPHAWRYQKVNAEYLAGRGAAVVLRDEDLPEQFLPLVQDLLIKNTEKRLEMQAVMQSLAVPDAAKRIAQFLQELAESAKKEVGNG